MVAFTRRSQKRPRITFNITLKSAARGLKHAFDLLSRKGLHAPSVQCTFHHNIQEALKHVAEAHFRDLWAVEGKVKDLSELRDKSADELYAMATRIYESRASTAALIKLKSRPRDDQDDVLISSAQFCRDVLNYLDLDDAMRFGDVDRMELPRLLFRYHGGGNSKYALEILEVLQGILREWTPDLKYVMLLYAFFCILKDPIRTIIMRYCWLANTTGRVGGHLPIDMVQEHNIRDIKVISIYCRRRLILDS